MTDNEIIKALECCKNLQDCECCPNQPCDVKKGTMACLCQAISNSIDLINRQKSEIERLTAMLEAAEDYLYPLPFKNAFDDELAKAKSEAIKEFAEKLKESALEVQIGSHYHKIVTVRGIDNFLEEMVGDTE